MGLVLQIFLSCKLEHTEIINSTNGLLTLICLIKFLFLIFDLDQSHVIFFPKHKKNIKAFVISYLNDGIIFSFFLVAYLHIHALVKNK